MQGFRCLYALRCHLFKWNKLIFKIRINCWHYTDCYIHESTLEIPHFLPVFNKYIQNISSTTSNRLYVVWYSFADTFEYSLEKIYLITFFSYMYILEKEMLYINMYMYISNYFFLYRYHPSSSSWILSSWNSCWKCKSNRCWHGKKCRSRLPHYWWRWDRYVWHYNWEGHTGRHHYCEKGVQLQHKQASLCLATRDFIVYCLLLH